MPQLDSVLYINVINLIWFNSLWLYFALSYVILPLIFGSNLAENMLTNILRLRSKAINETRYVLDKKIESSLVMSLMNAQLRYWMFGLFFKYFKSNRNFEEPWFLLHTKWRNIYYYYKICWRDANHYVFVSPYWDVEKKFNNVTWRNLKKNIFLIFVLQLNLLHTDV